MLRRDREVTDPDRIAQILDEAKVVHVGLNDGGYPYVVPLHYGYELANGRLVLYMHGAQKGHKLDLVRADMRVGFELDCEVQTTFDEPDLPCSYGFFYASVMGRGEISLIEDASQKVHALQVLMEHQTGRSFQITPQMAKGASVFRIVANTYSAKSRPLPQTAQGSK